MTGMYDYGYWPMVIIYSLVFIVFAFSFTRPKSWRDWRSFGAFAAFVVALFTEMYGFPLTIYLLSGWLSSRYPGLELYAHQSGHLWQTLFGIGGSDPAGAHFNWLHLLSEGLILLGVVVIINAWRVLYRAQKEGRVATSGPYARVRHPQYIGFVAVLFGFLLQWPTILTLAMFPVLVWMYARLARIEEREVKARFGEAYAAYAAQVPAFVPHWRRRYDGISLRSESQRASHGTARSMTGSAEG
jgi:protein-S-isoprenylcysteine O-methyltransferase Ste14